MKNEEDMTKQLKNLEKAQMEWQRKRQDRIDYINEQLLKEKKAEQKFNELDDAMSEYSRVFKTQLPSLPPRPVLSDYYRPSDEQHDRELAFITIG